VTEMGNESKYYLIIGDSHIPDRASHLPIEFEEFLSAYSKKIKSFDQVFFTGDLIHSPELEDYLNGLSVPHNMEIVSGNMDLYSGIERDSYIIYTIKDFPELIIGLIHGHQVHSRGDSDELRKIADRLKVNILISGHTHSDSININEKTLLLNPGSCVGAWSSIASGIPSFFIMQLCREKNKSILITINIIKLENQINQSSELIQFKNSFKI
jgi:putative phosphoesterase